ncbi:MAG: hypothetical protein JJE52_08855 [Acidimicrobiia bacterium]|nr:hypothetical protein [Acidimicrobiia bacterium]
MRITVERLARPRDPQLIDELVELRRAVATVLEPDDPPIGPAELIPDLFVDRPEQSRAAWLARSAERPVGLIVAGVNVEGANAGYSEVEVDVHPDHLADGVEPALVREALPWMCQLGARTVAAWPAVEQRGAFEAVGLTFRQEERCSRADVGEIDAALLDEWIAAPRARAAGYRIETWAGPCPEHLVDEYAVARSAMADAPLDDIDFVPAAIDSERVRASDASIEALGYLSLPALVLDIEGAAAGMTLLLVHPERPQLGHQEDTAVVPAHRGHALGRWLKAENLRRARSLVPELAVVETYNAASNPWMLSINVDMGFRPHRPYYAYQANLDDLTVD